ncbi:tetratricopeptide repeat protein [Bradyrhizobium sp. USDA 4513]
MKDLNFILSARPDYQPALTLRGITWSALRNYDKAVEDLDRAIAQKETVEGLFARAKAHEALNHVDKATEDFRKATQLTPSSVFDVLAQAESKRKVQQLSKRVPCGNGQSGTCL